MNAQFQRGMLLYQQGRYQEAVAELRLCLAQEGEDYLTHSFAALSLGELEQFAEATEHAQRAIHLAPDEAFGHYALSRVMIGRQRYDEARAAIREAIQLDPLDANYFGILASLELQKSDWRAALAAANQGLALDPEHTLCTNLRAQALVKLGDREAAAATMGEALARRPDDAYTHANQGWALLHAGQPKPALEHFRESLRLDPELEWSRAGIVEALKARNFVYRWMLAWFLWMSRLTPGARWGVVIGAYVGQRLVQGLARTSPELAPFLWPLLYLYFAFALLTWLAPSLFNLLLRLDRFGWYALSANQVRGANLLAACLFAAGASLGGFFATGSEVWLIAAIYTGLLTLPASAIYVCDSGWPRQAMAVITLALLAGSLFVLTVIQFEKSLPPAAMNIAAPFIAFLPLGMIASQFAANYLTQVTPTR
ncbi:MAG TPA: tetratricopeptide repeat protein [Pirellulaceae bacterium]|jgi:tetratricopeptide (TPR) repeat protein